MALFRRPSKAGRTCPLMLLVALLSGALALAGCGGGGSTTPASLGTAPQVDPTLATLSGQVTDDAGNPVADALVELLPPVQARGSVLLQAVVTSTTTDQGGNYTMGGITPGLYLLQVTAAGFKPWRWDLDLGTGITLLQNVQFWPDQPVAVFQSSAYNLVAGDAMVPDYITDVFLATGLPDCTLQKVTWIPEGTEGGDSRHPVLSDSGRFLVFQSLARLDSDGLDQDATVDVYRHDRKTGRMTCLTADLAQGEAVTNYFLRPFTSGDGRLTVFEWDTGEGLDKQVYLHDADTGQITLVSAGLQGPPNGPSNYPVVSAQGRFIAFSSKATNLVPDQAAQDTRRHVFVYDRLRGTTVRASVAAGGALSDSDSETPSISGDGRLVAFTSSATNLLESPMPQGMVYVRDLAAGTTFLASAASDGTPATAYCQMPVLSGDGRRVAFQSLSPLVPGVTYTDSAPNIFVRDLQAGTTILASISPDGTAAANNGSFTAVLPFDQDHVLYYSYATNLIPDLVQYPGLVYCFDLSTSTNSLVSHKPDGSPGGPGDSMTRY